MTEEQKGTPTLCPRCIHFVKAIDCGCRIGNFGIEGAVAANIQRWLRSQSYESSWTYQGACPSFKYNGSAPHLMKPDDQRALRKLVSLQVGE